MAAPPVDVRSQLAETLDLRPTGDDGVVLRVRPKEGLGDFEAGRFFMLRREDSSSPAIPRPFSAYRRFEDGSVDFLIKVMGAGTKALADLRPGQDLRLIGPLGSGWPQLAPEGPPLVMIGGGIGSAPFYMAIQQAQQKAAEITFIYGAATSGLLYDVELFEELGARVVAATDDGTRGFHGNVVQALEAEWRAGRLPEKVRLMTCGPDGMMKAVVRVARERGLECLLSLETYMGCGVGICNGCAVATVPTGEDGDWPVAKCCIDGPVFDSRAVLL